MNQSTLPKKTKEKIVIYQLILAGLLLFNTLLIMVNNSKIGKLAKQQIIGVQLEDGTAIKAEKKSSSYRDDKVIKDFVQKWYYLNLNWTSTDEPIEVDSIQIPGNIYAASLALSTKNGFDKQFNKEMSDLIAKIDNSKTLQSSVNISYISDKPVQVSEGVWDIIVVANWVVFNNENTQLISVPFNKKLRLKAVPLAKEESLQQEFEGMQKVINNVKQYGLEITKIENYDG
jgi:hypothetical protein